MAWRRCNWLDIRSSRSFSFRRSSGWIPVSEESQQAKAEARLGPASRSEPTSRDRSCTFAERAS